MLASLYVPSINGAQSYTAFNVLQMINNGT